MTTDPGTCERPAVKTDAAVNAAYAKLREGQFGRTIDAAEGVMVDIDPDGWMSSALRCWWCMPTAARGRMRSSRLAMAGIIELRVPRIPVARLYEGRQRAADDSGGRVLAVIHIPTGVISGGPDGARGRGRCPYSARNC